MNKETFSICCRRGEEEIFCQAAQKAGLEVESQDWGESVNLVFGGSIGALWQAIDALYPGGLRQFWEDEEARRRKEWHLI